MLGYETVGIEIVADDKASMADSFRRAAERAELVVVTGGLGPTSDDLTREALAEAFQRPLSFREEVWADIERLMGRRLSSANRRQAYVPEGFTALRNRLGTAPALWGELERSAICALPGPPQELRELVEHELVPKLASRADIETDALVLAVFGMGESTLEERLAVISRELPADGLRWATEARPYEIILTLSGSSEEGRELVYRTLLGELGEYDLVRGRQGLAGAGLDRLRERGKRLVTAESCTGGLIAAALTEIAGSSRAFWGGFVVYANDAKQRELGVSSRTLETYGAVSRETVSEMLSGALARSGSELAVAVSGIAGPGGGSEEKPVGTVFIGVSDGEDERIVEHHYDGDRERVRRRSVIDALRYVRRIA